MISKIIEKINSSKSFLITSHVNLEGDALGSELAMYSLLKKLKKNAVIFNSDTTPKIYSFLPYCGIVNSVRELRSLTVCADGGISASGGKPPSASIGDNRPNNVRAAFSNGVKDMITEEKFDVAFALDCSDSFRAGKVSDYLGQSDCIINIDHHISNTFFGDINWVEPKASSTCQMIYSLCNKLGIMNKEIALCLYTGIFTDTGNFTYANTTGDTHKVISELMKYNINPHIIYSNIHSLCNSHDLQFISKVISSLRFDSRKKICWAKIKRWEEKGYDLTEVIFSVMRLLKDVEVFILFKKVSKNKVRVNLRSRYSVDVNKIALFFGGGGHKRASGTTLECGLEAAERKIISFVRRYTNGMKLEGSRKVFPPDRRFEGKDRRQIIVDRRQVSDRRQGEDRPRVKTQKT